MKNLGAPPLFTSNVRATDSDYLGLRDESHLVEERNICIEMWERFYPYADRQFREDITHQFHNRFWEMYLGCAMLDLGKELIRTKEGTPDLCVIDSGRTIWIEAVAPRKGTADDAVPGEHITNLDEESDSRDSSVPSEQIIMRFAQSVREKINQYQRYREVGVVQEGELFLIALNGAEVGFNLLELDECPRIVRSLLGIGLPQFDFNINRDKVEVVNRGFQYQPFVRKLSGSEVSTAAFIDPANAGISGLIYSCVAVDRLRSFADRFDPFPLGKDFVLIHNPYAASATPVGWLKRGRELMVGISLKGRWIEHSNEGEG